MALPEVVSSAAAASCGVTRGTLPNARRDTLRIAQMNVSLRPLGDRDLDTIYQQVTDPESIRMAAFTAEDQTDRRAFLNRMTRVRADTSATNRVIDVDGAIAGTIASFRIDNQLEVTYWVDRTHWGKGIASAALQILLAETAERPLYARAASDNVGSLRVLEKLGSDALASTATSHPVSVRRSRKRSCASTAVGTELCVSS
jgi:RimJ/RimL family protein N-acetyltransferase